MVHGMNPTGILRELLCSVFHQEQKGNRRFSTVASSLVLPLPAGMQELCSSPHILHCRLHSIYAAQKAEVQGKSTKEPSFAEHLRCCSHVATPLCLSSTMFKESINVSI
ncbi:hypothetical protein KIL84_004886 [Mauremys mutica]|uniref:Uncharacterized protein n=1 Tax=Mauremys mutica TaxID=74926 RepID=A0A9D3XMM0_9SAUR|nr:hypothetical protein KIL84_004886 [Mauremys mutica]